ncbi:MAG: REP-associated tyrosine transposase [Methylocella sp.]
MPDYRRAHVPGGSFFFTLVTAGRRRFLCKENARVLLRQALESARDRWPFRIHAFVLLPDHLHTIWTLPRDDADFSTRWAWTKKEFTKGWLALGEAEVKVSVSKRRDRRRGVWQRRFWEHVLEDENDLEKHCDYIHYNPVKHGLVHCSRDWPYSSFARFVKSGDYAADWGCSERPPPDFGDLDQTAME